MDFNDKDIRKISLLILILVLAVLVFILVKPILLSILGGLILAYTFFPLYKVVLNKIKAKNTAASIISVFVILLIIIPLYFLAPLMINQVFEVFQYAKTVNSQNFIKGLFPSAPESFIVQLTVTADNIISKISSGVLNYLINFLLEIPTILFNLIIVAFVFFFALRDGDKLSEFFSALSPLEKSQEKKLVQQFKDITNSVVYGQIMIGLVQGIIAGLGFFIFGIPNALILTLLAVVLSIIPLIGPFILWGPAVIFLFLKGNTVATTTYLIYNVFIVSTIDNILRIYLLTKKTKLSQAIVLIGMIGGLFIFGVLGLIIGPLLLAYFLTFLEAYKDKNFSSLFKSD
ncbi:MAG: AI-2E family transporter [Nanoarchaeota archaeon]